MDKNTKTSLILIAVFIIIIALVSFIGGPRFSKKNQGPIESGRSSKSENPALLFESVKELTARIEYQARNLTSEIEKYRHLQSILRNP